MPPTPTKHEPGRVTLSAPPPASRQDRGESQRRRIEQGNNSAINQLGRQPLVGVEAPRLLYAPIKVPEGFLRGVKILTGHCRFFDEGREERGLAHAVLSCYAYWRVLVVSFSGRKQLKWRLSVQQISS